MLVSMLQLQALLQGHMFSKIQGIELLQDLNDASQEMIKNYKKVSACFLHLAFYTYNAPILNTLIFGWVK